MLCLQQCYNFHFGPRVCSLHGVPDAGQRQGIHSYVQGIHGVYIVYTGCIIYIIYTISLNASYPVYISNIAQHPMYNVYTESARFRKYTQVNIHVYTGDTWSTRGESCFTGLQPRL